MRTTEEVLKDLLTEDTGKHFLDSGGDNGRHWQRNKDRDFDKEPIVVPEFYNGELEYVTVNVYHYLKEVLELDDLCYFINNRIQTSGSAKDIHWTGDISDEWMKLALNLYNGLLGKKYEFLGDWEWRGDDWNTYNGESNLSQVLQGRFFVVDDEPYVMLQIHQGADVRGGYTQPKCFKLKGLLMGNVDICGSVNDLPIDNMYNGYSLTDEEGNEVDIKETDDLVLDMLICEDTCVY
jgi:hypothetical protein